MRLQVTKVLNTKKPYHPSGKEYTVYSWTVSGLIDNDQDEGLFELKAFKEYTVEVGSTLEVEKQNYMGKVSYKILKQVTKQQAPLKNSPTPPDYTQNSKQRYTLEEYNNLFRYAWLLFEPRLLKIVDPSQRYECLQKLVSTFIISAVQIGIKAPPTFEEAQSYKPVDERRNLLHGGIAI